MTVRVLPALVFFPLLLGFNLPVHASQIEGKVERHSAADDSRLTGGASASQQEPSELQGAAQRNTDENLKAKTTSENQTNIILKGGTVGGEATIGCLGAYFQNNGTLRAIYPPCDLNRLGVVVGDRILLVNGKKFPGVHKFQRECVGFPGTVMNLVILHDGEPRAYEVRRIDSRELVQFGSGYYKHYATKSVTW
jgi:hypothetical protein